MVVFDVNIIADTTLMGKIPKNIIKVACTSGQFFRKNYEAVPHIFFTNKLPSD